VHPVARSEPSLDVAIENKAGFCIKAESVRIGCDLNAARTQITGSLDSIHHEAAANPPVHPLRLDEEVLQFNDISRQRYRGKPDRLPSRNYCYSGSPFRYGDAGMLKNARVREQCGPVTLVRQGRAPIDSSQFT
jgi:hypothetical protein